MHVCNEERCSPPPPSQPTNHLLVDMINSVEMWYKKTDTKFENLKFRSSSTTRWSKTTSVHLLLLRIKIIYNTYFKDFLIRIKRFLSALPFLLATLLLTGSRTDNALVLSSFSHALFSFYIAQWGREKKRKKTSLVMWRKLFQSRRKVLLLGICTYYCPKKRLLMTQVYRYSIVYLGAICTHIRCVQSHDPLHIPSPSVWLTEQFQCYQNGSKYSVCLSVRLSHIGQLSISIRREVLNNVR